MNAAHIKLLLADDDKDDCMLFREALSELPLSADLNTVHDGEQLMNYLNSGIPLPAALFLDLNMPRKNGFECLAEIRRNDQFRQLPVIIISTSFDESVSRSLFEEGANHYICKPTEFGKLKEAIFKALTFTKEAKAVKPRIENFVLFNES